MKKVLCMFLFLVLSFAIAGCATDDPPIEEQGEQVVEEVVAGDDDAPAAVVDDEPDPVVHEGDATVITKAIWWQAGDDPHWRDPITGEIAMDPFRQWALETAWNTVYDELNVQIEFVQYPGDLRQVLLTSVLAGAPFADIVGLWGGSQGTVLAQNILRPLDPFADIFADDESSWMFLEPLFGNHFFLQNEIAHILTWPLVFNISLIEQVDGLRDETGRTIFPTDLYLAGEWTWSRFEEYLEIIEAHFRGVPAPVRPEETITPFQTDYRFTTRKAMHSAGVAVFGGQGLQIDTTEAIAAVEFIDRLINRGLMNIQLSHGVVPGWTWSGYDFRNGEMVFAEIPNWHQSGAGTVLAERGESMGLIPFPRPDFLPAGDPRSRMELNPGNSFAVLRGTSDERARIALEAFRMYTIHSWRNLGGVDVATDFRAATAEAQAIALGYDIFHPIIGQDILYIFANYSPPSPNEFVDIVGISDLVLQDIVGQSIFGFDGSPAYPVQVAQMVHLVHDQLAIIGNALLGDDFVDNIAPGITSRPVVMPLGSNLDTFNLSEFFDVEDNVDGVLNVHDALVYIEWQWGDNPPTDPNTPGTFNPGVRIRVQDLSGNLTGWHNQQVWVFDPANTVPPTFELQEEFPVVELDTSAADINWNHFIAVAVDAHGNDLRGRMVPDLGFLDVTLPGTYPVEITVEDFAGNVSTITIEVTVE